METKVKEEFLARIREQFPQEAELFIEAIEREPKPSIRINTKKAQGKDVDVAKDKAQDIPWNSDGMWLNQRPQYTMDPMFHAGVYYPQEASSQFLAHVIDAIKSHLPENPVVLDLCAAPGGKTTLVAGKMDGRGVVVANEIVRQRAWVLRENVAKSGWGNCIVTNSDAKAFGKLGATFDLVLIDAPCSGEGMFRKDEVARSEWSVENARMCAERQREILDDIWPAVAEGGIVVYSTCTFNPDENEGNMEWLAENYDVENITIDIDQSWGVGKIAIGDGEGYAFHPHKVDGEGFFICIMQKKSGGMRRTPKTKLKPQKTALPNGLMENGMWKGYVWEGNIVALPQDRDMLMLAIADNVKPIWIGVPVGQKMKDDIVWSAELPMQQAFRGDGIARVQLEKEDALHYLRGEWTYAGEMEKGWNIVIYKGVALGLVKSVGNRVNNYYPKEWRIRKMI